MCSNAFLFPKWGTTSICLKLHMHCNICTDSKSAFTSWRTFKVSYKSHQLKPKWFYQSVSELLTYTDSELKSLNMLSQLPYRDYNLHCTTQLMFWGFFQKWLFLWKSSEHNNVHCVYTTDALVNIVMLSVLLSTVA